VYQQEAIPFERGANKEIAFRFAQGFGSLALISRLRIKNASRCSGCGKHAANSLIKEGIAAASQIGSLND
jgi:hypothetical protein